MALKKFNATLVQTLNGIDTYSFDHVCASAETASRYVEAATIAVNINGVLAFAGSVKSTSVKNTGFIKSVTAESAMAVARDQDLEEATPRGLTRTSVLLQDVAPSSVTINYLASVDPPVKYAFRSGSILTHLNTICAMNGLNWRGGAISPTESVITISDRGDIAADIPVFIENVDIFNLTIDKSLFKQPTKVTAVGVEEEVSGYICTADLIQTATRLILDCDDGELYDDEIPVPGEHYEYMSDIKQYGRLLLDHGAELSGWETNSHFLLNNECMAYSSKSGNTLLGITREVYGTMCLDTHIHGDACALFDRLRYTLPTGVSTFNISPATTLFKIGSEIIQVASIGSTYLELSTIDPNTGFMIGRGLALDSGSGNWITDPSLVYPHKRGTPIIPYYPNSDAEAPASMLSVTIHGKGIVSKDGIDKLAWGALTNLQNGILSGKFTYKAGDFGDKSIGVGQWITIQTATTKTGPASTNIVTPATTYDALIYSITRTQNKLLTVEFGNVIPEIMTLLKSGEYAMQAAIRKQPVQKTTETYDSSLSGKVAKIKSTQNRVKLIW
jgi:hypothetical protein